MPRLVSQIIAWETNMKVANPQAWKRGQILCKFNRERPHFLNDLLTL